MNDGISLPRAVARRGAMVLRALFLGALCLAALLAVAEGVHAQTVTLTASPNPSAAGQSVVLSAAVSGSAPTGAVTSR